MKMPVKTSIISFFLLFLLIVSCQKETELHEISPELDSQTNGDPFIFSKGPLSHGESLPPQFRDIKTIPQSFVKKSGDIFSGIESCSPTDFQKVRQDYLESIASDPLAAASYNFYSNLSFVGSIIDDSEQYFGKDGEYTKLVNKTIRDLERFWNMQAAVDVHGQHNETLDNREKLADILLYFVEDIEHPDHIYPYVEEVLDRNSSSPYLPESPLFSGDAFSTYDNTIVIGDGLVQMLSETGLDPEVVWTGLLAHLWAHQVQLQLISNTPRDPLFELEADFLAAYYLAHKRGATYNWKKAEQFLDLFFQLGECGASGTPQNRMESARSGYHLALDAQKKGHILTAAEAHQAFLKYLAR